MDGMTESSAVVEDPVAGEDVQEVEVAIDEAGGVAVAAQYGVDMAAEGGDQTAVVTSGDVVDAELSEGEVIPASISGLVGSSSESGDEDLAEASLDLYQDVDGFSAMDSGKLLNFFDALAVMQQGAVVTRVDWVRETPEGQVARVLAFAPGGCPMDIRKPGSTHWRGIPLTLFHAVDGGAVSAPGFLSNGYGSDRSLHGIDLLAEDWVVVEGMDSPVLPLPV